MDEIALRLENLKTHLLGVIPIGGLHSRNPVVYKWKAPFRAWMLREAVFWRLHDLLTQSHTLHGLGHGLGARILLRSAFESLATLVYLNQSMRDVLDGRLNFHAFSDRTTVLLIGSRNNPDSPRSINIMTVLSKCERRYPGLMKIYEDLSESAHPSYEGLCTGYSKIDHDEYETVFSNRWMDLHGHRHASSLELCLVIFEHEYDDAWPKLLEEMEKWIQANDTHLEATKNDLIAKDA